MKERLIGAIILVVIAVIVLPWLLHKPASSRYVNGSLPLPPDQTRSSVINVPLHPRLAPGAVTGPIMHSSSAPAVAAKPAATSSTKPTKQVASVPNTTIPHLAVPHKVAQEPPDSAGIKKKISASTSDSSGAAGTTHRVAGQSHSNHWAVQAASLRDKSKAKRLAARLAKAGYPAYVTRFDDRGTRFFRVRIGPYNNRKKAHRIAARISENVGSKAVVLPYLGGRRLGSAS